MLDLNKQFKCIYVLWEFFQLKEKKPTPKREGSIFKIQGFIIKTFTLEFRPNEIFQSLMKAPDDSYV